MNYQYSKVGKCYALFTAHIWGWKKAKEEQEMSCFGLAWLPRSKALLQTATFVVLTNKIESKGPILVHEIPTRPWSRVGADLFEINNQKYLIMVDYYCINLLQNSTTSKRIVTHNSPDMNPDNRQWSIIFQYHFQVILIRLWIPAPISKSTLPMHSAWQRELSKQLRT